MHFIDVLDSVAYRAYQPHHRHPEWLLWFLLRRPRLRRALEFANTHVVTDDPRTHALLWELSLMRRMSSLTIGLLLREAVARMPPDRAYVNVGTWEGFSLFAGMAGNEDKRCIGIDNFSEYDKPRATFLAAFERRRVSPHHEFHDAGCEDYFARIHRGPIGVYFYDGAHDEMNQYRGLEIAEPFFVPGTLVFVDDTDYAAPRRATERFLRERSGRYDLLRDERVARPGHPTWWNGLMVFRKR